MLYHAGKLPSEKRAGVRSRSNFRGYETSAEALKSRRFHRKLGAGEAQGTEVHSGDIVREKKIHGCEANMMR